MIYFEQIIFYLLDFVIFFLILCSKLQMIPIISLKIVKNFRQIIKSKSILLSLVFIRSGLLQTKFYLCFKISFIKNVLNLSFLLLLIISCNANLYI